MPEDRVQRALQQTHPEFEENLNLWDYTLAHYDERIIYADLAGSGESRFLPKKAQAEVWEEYIERKKVSPYANYLAPILDSLVGLLFNKEREAQRDWGSLGLPDDSRTLAGLLSRDADGTGTDHEAQLKQLATDTMLYQKVGVLVDTNRPSGESLTALQARQRGIRPFWRLIPPQALVNWRHDARGRLVEALIKEKRDTRGSISDPAADSRTETFLWLFLGGFLRFQKTGRGKIRMLDAGDSEYLDISGLPTIPLHIAELPVRRYPAHSVARFNNSIFNLESQVFWMFRKSAWSRFIFSGDGYDEFLEEAKKHGANVVHEKHDDSRGNGHRYVSAPTDSVEAALKYRENLIRSLFRSAAFEFSDSAVERTATEINADFIATIGSTLTTLAGAVDEAENAALHLLEQAAGMEPGDARVERVRDFTVKDRIAVAKEWRDIIAGQNQSLPLNDAERRRVTQRILEQLGFPDEVMDDEEAVETGSDQGEAA